MDQPDPASRSRTQDPAAVERVLVLSTAPGGTDDPASGALAESDLAVRTVGTVAELREELERGAGALFVAAATLRAGDLDQLRSALEDDLLLARLPVFVLGGATGRRPKGAEQLAGLDNVTVLEAPPSGRTIVAAARAALRDRQRQAYVSHLLGRIEEAERREERLLAVLGHELRNPLGVITTALSLMRRIEGEEGGTARYRQMIERQVESLTHRIDELLDPEEAGEGDHQREWPPPQGRERRPAARQRERPAEPVLVVEDNTDARVALAELLELWGYVVEDAATGEEALEKAAVRQPAIALVDLDLPGIDGFEVARRLRAAKKDRLLIAMSGYGQAEDRQRSFAAGFDRHLVKPVDPSRLAQLLETRPAASVA